MTYVWPEVSALSWSFVVSVHTGAKDSTTSCNSFYPSSINFNLLFSLSLIDCAEARKIQETFQHVICRTPTCSRMSSQRFLNFFGLSPHLVSAELTTFHLDQACFVTKCCFNQLGFRALLLRFPNVQISVEVHHQPYKL